MRPCPLLEPVPQLDVVQRDHLGIEHVPSLDVPALQWDDMVVDTGVFDLLQELDEQVFAQGTLDVQAFSAVARAGQPADVEQVLEVPVLHVDDPGDDPVLEADLEELEAAEAIRMDWLEHQILTGVPVSAADRAAWRRWAFGGGLRPDRGRR